MQKLEVSERKACSVLGLNRTTKRYKSKKSDDEAVLREAIVRLASKYGRYGYRRIAAMLKSEGWKVNHKRVERIWREEGLRVPKKQKKRGRIYLRNGSCIRLKPLYQNHVRSYDCVEDRLANGRKIKCLTVIDEFTRESLAIRVERVEIVFATPSVFSDIADNLLEAFEAAEVKAPPMFFDAAPVRADRFWLARLPRIPVIADDVLFVIRLSEPRIRPVAKSV